LKTLFYHFPSDAQDTSIAGVGNSLSNMHSLFLMAKADSLMYMRSLLVLGRFLEEKLKILEQDRHHGPPVSVYRK
jgi:hypothetical protein